MKYFHLKGFTLVETLVAITILALSVAGPFFAAQKALTAAIIAKNKMTASYLAQEGLEYVHAMRSNVFFVDLQANINDISDEAFMDFLHDSSFAGSIALCRDEGGANEGLGTISCALDTDPTVPMGTGAGKALTSCGSGSCSALRLYNGRYTLNPSGTLTPFTRSIRFYDVGEVVEVRVTVSWVERGVTRSVTISNYLSAWQ